MTDNTIGNILHELMEGMSESALARAVKLPKATVHRVVSGITPDPRARTLLPIAQYFNISIEQLMGITALPNNTRLKSAGHQQAIEMPFISFNKLKEWSNGSYTPEQSYNITSLSNKTLDAHYFITKVNSDEMAPLFSTGTFLLIRKQRTATKDSIVLVYNSTNNKFLIRKYIELNGEKYLLSSNPSYDILKLDNKMELIGVVTEGRIVI